MVKKYRYRGRESGMKFFDLNHLNWNWSRNLQLLWILIRIFRRDREHESEKKDLRKRETSGDARRRKKDETEEERKIRKGMFNSYSKSEIYGTNPVSETGSDPYQIKLNQLVVKLDGP